MKSMPLGAPLDAAAGTVNNQMGGPAFGPYGTPVSNMGYQQGNIPPWQQQAPQGTYDESAPTNYGFPGAPCNHNMNNPANPPCGPLCGMNIGNMAGMLGTMLAASLQAQGMPGPAPPPGANPGQNAANAPG